jgi:hypothetical protein
VVDLPHVLRKMMSQQQSEVQIDELRMSLEPVEGNPPFRSTVQGLRLQVTDSVLAKMVEVALAKGRDRAPVDVELRSTRFMDEGAEVVVQVSKGRFLKTDVRTLVGLAAADNGRVRVDIKEVKALGKLPIDSFVDPILDKALGMATRRPGIERAGSRSLLVRPDEVLAGLGVPLTFAADGSWDIDSHVGGFALRFRAGF